MNIVTYVSAGDDNKVRIYTLDVRTLTPSVELDHLGPITDVSFSLDSKLLVAADANRKVILYSTDEYKVICSIYR